MEGIGKNIPGTGLHPACMIARRLEGAVEGYQQANVNAVERVLRSVVVRPDHAGLID